MGNIMEKPQARFLLMKAITRRKFPLKEDNELSILRILNVSSKVGPPPQNLKGTAQKEQNRIEGHPWRKTHPWDLMYNRMNLQYTE